jgi:hypothetical protein
MVNIRISLLLSFLATAFPWDKINNDTLEYSRVKCYSGILCALAKLSSTHKKYQHRARACWLERERGVQAHAGEIECSAGVRTFGCYSTTDVLKSMYSNFVNTF